MEWLILLIFIMLIVGMFFRGIIALTVMVIFMCASNALLGVIMGVITYVLMYVIPPVIGKFIEPDEELDD